MDRRSYEKMSRLFKILAKVVGVLLMAYGCIVGIFGLGPDGPMGSSLWRLIGLFLLLEGILYFISNKKIKESAWLTKVYFIVTSLPILIILVAACFSIVTSGMGAFINDGGLITVAVLLPISIPAPLSLMFFVLGAAS